MLVLEGVSKRYGETIALDGIDVAMSVGHVHTVLGENGSRKSTLVKLLPGVVPPDRGTLRLDKRFVTRAHPAGARAQCIPAGFQGGLLAPARPPRENILL